MASILPANGTLTRRQAAHLLRRATFGATKQQIDQFTGLDFATAVARVLQPVAAQPPAPLEPVSGFAMVDPPNGRFRLQAPNSEDFPAEEYLLAWWVSLMVRSELTIAEKMVFFLHTHFTNMRSRMSDITAVYYQLAFFRHYALGNFKELAAKMCTDNAMLKFLDGRLNEKGRPQENFARELFELYTVGKGPQQGPDNYTTFTEDDVREAARVLSGWADDTDFENLDADTGFAIGKLKTDNSGLLARRHDAGEKVFSAAFNNQTIAPATVDGDLATVEAATDELRQLIDMIFASEATALHICRRLYRFFVYYKIDEEIERDIIAPMAQTFRDSGYELQPVLQQLFRSQHFFDLDDAEVRNNNTGAIIKSPLELSVGMLRFFEVAGPDPQAEPELLLQGHYERLLEYMNNQGLNLLEPFEVAGYPAYHQAPAFHRSWISANYLAQRYRLADELLAMPEDMMQPGFFLDALAWVENPRHVADPSDAQQIVRALADYLLPEELPAERFDYFLNAILLDNLSAVNWRFEWLQYASTGNDVAIRVQIQNLVRAMLQSPEYQLQ